LTLCEVRKYDNGSTEKSEMIHQTQIWLKSAVTCVIQNVLSPSPKHQTDID
jgi:hypothetical protein